MTRVEAISRILRACGMRSVTSDTDTRNAVLCGQFMDAADKDVQSLGWNENTEDRVEVNRNSTTNQITDVELRTGLSADIEILSFVPTEESRFLEVVRRGSTLYWRDDSISDTTPWTKTFDDDIVVTRIIRLPFEQLTHHLAAYITLETAKHAYSSEFGSKETDPRRRREIASSISREYLEAKVMAESNLHAKQRTNVLDTPQAAAVRGRVRGFSFR